MEYIVDNHFLYGVVHNDLWAAENYIIANFINKYQWNLEDIFRWWENPGINYKTSFNKSTIESFTNKKLIIIPPFLYKKYYYIFKTLNCYIFIVDLSIYELNFFENIKILKDFINCNDVIVDYHNESIQSYNQINNEDYHKEILWESLSRGSLDWEYLRKNWDFLHWYISYWLSNILITNLNTPWNYGKSLILLMEYFPCLYSFFPEKKVLTCNYLHHMFSVCKKSK